MLSRFITAFLPRRKHLVIYLINQNIHILSSHFTDFWEIPILMQPPLQFSSVQSLSYVWLFVTPWTATCQASLSITNPWSLPKLMSIELVVLSNHLILCCPLLFPPSIFLSIGVFSMNQLFPLGEPSIGVSASTSVFPMNTQVISFSMDWLDLLVVFTKTRVQKHKFFSIQLSL